jgi:transposase-like protein
MVNWHSTSWHGEGIEQQSGFRRGNGSSSGFSNVNGIAIALIVIAVLAIVVLMLSLIKKNKSSSSHYLDGQSHYMDDQLSNNRSFTPLVANDKGVFFPYQSMICTATDICNVTSF